MKCFSVVLALFTVCYSTGAQQLPSSESPPSAVRDRLDIVAERVKLSSDPEPKLNVEEIGPMLSELPELDAVEFRELAKLVRGTERDHQRRFYYTFVLYTLRLFKVAVPKRGSFEYSVYGAYISMFLQPSDRHKPWPWIPDGKGGLSLTPTSTQRLPGGGDVSCYGFWSSFDYYHLLDVSR
jgi:hypothetical protein